MGLIVRLNSGILGCIGGWKSIYIIEFFRDFGREMKIRSNNKNINLFL